MSELSGMSITLSFDATSAINFYNFLLSFEFIDSNFTILLILS